ncbi:MAG: hypothetical protein ACE5GV_00285 [Candidatus Scalindua sp.]
MANHMTTLFKLTVLSGMIIPFTVNADEIQEKENELPKYAVQYVLPQLSFTKQNYYWGKSVGFTYGVTYVYEHEKPNDIYYFGSATGASAHIKIKPSSIYSGIIWEREYNPLILIFSGKFGHTWKLPRNCLFTPYISLSNDITFPSPKNSRRCLAKVYTGVGFKFTHNYRDSIRIGLSAGLSNLVGSSCGVRRSYRIGDKWGYAISTPIGWKTSRSDKWSFVFEPSISTQDFKQNKGFFGVGFKTIYTF